MYVDKVKITFHHGSSYAPEGITKKPFATLVMNEMVNRELIDKICQLVRDDMNEMGDFCNIKIQSENWDC